jgi:hypothetical protein
VDSQMPFGILSPKGNCLHVTMCARKRKEQCQDNQVVPQQVNAHSIKMKSIRQQVCIVLTMTRLDDLRKRNEVLVLNSLSNST